MKRSNPTSNTIWPKGYWTRPHYEGAGNICVGVARGLSGFRFSQRHLDPSGVGYSVVPERDYERMESTPCPKGWSPYVPL